jgi:hypothetical protein
MFAQPRLASKERTRTWGTRLYSQSFDVCELVRILCGRRCLLNRPSRDTLHRGKRMFSHPRYKGLGAVEIWRIGETGRVTQYCKHDVKLLVELVSHIRSHGFLVVRGQRKELPWQLALRAHEVRKRPSAPSCPRPINARRPSSATLGNALFRIGAKDNSRKTQVSNATREILDLPS